VRDVMTYAVQARRTWLFGRFGRGAAYPHEQRASDHPPRPGTRAIPHGSQKVSVHRPPEHGILIELSIQDELVVKKNDQSRLGLGLPTRTTYWSWCGWEAAW